jgi:hypothetical protein
MASLTDSSSKHKDYVAFKKARKNLTLIINGNNFHQNPKKLGWKCSKYNTIKCLGRAYVIKLINGNWLVYSEGHICQFYMHNTVNIDGEPYGVVELDATHNELHTSFEAETMEKLRLTIYQSKSRNDRGVITEPTELFQLYAADYSINSKENERKSDTIRHEINAEASEECVYPGGQHEIIPTSGACDDHGPIRRPTNKTSDRDQNDEAEIKEKSPRNSFYFINIINKSNNKISKKKRDTISHFRLTEN